MEYTHVKALVPEGEPFDSSAVNDGVWLSQTHLANIDKVLGENATAVANLNSGLTETETKLNAAVDAHKVTEESLSAANQTIADKDQEIAKLQDKVTALENKTEDPKQTSTDADKTGNSAKTWDNPMNRLADSLLGVPKPTKTAE